MNYLFFDTESYSECDLKKAGTHQYADHPSTEITVAQWALNDGEVIVEDLFGRKPLSAALQRYLLNPDWTIVAHHSAFDRTLVRKVWGMEIPIPRWHDTMIQAMVHGLPGALGKVGEVLGLPLDLQKDKRGTALIQLFCKPTPKNQKRTRNTPTTHPEQWSEFLEYSYSDIVSMREVFNRLPMWNYRGRELALWHLDQVVNDRGFAVDVELARAAIEVSEIKKADMREEILDLTDGDVTSATRRDVLLKHILAYYGVNLPDLKKDTLKRRMDDPELPSGVRQLLAIRLEASMASTSKYKALLAAVSPDGRLRNTLQFAGAVRTRRWAGRIFQPQNMMRPTMKKADIALGIDLIKARRPTYLFPDVMTLTGNAVRGCIVAPPGRKLCIADLANIEGRGLVQLSGEQWKLQAFRDYDKGSGPDMYKLAYARSFGVDHTTVEGDQRQIGKVQELGLGYGGGVAAFLTFAAVYNMDLDKMADAVWGSAANEVLTDGMGMWKWAEKKRRTIGLSQRVYVACEVLKRLWRDAHPMTEALWNQCHEAFRMATKNPGVTFDAGVLKFRRDKAWLRVRLPSGNYLCYLQPQVDENGGCSYQGLNPYTRQWRRVYTYGGKIVAECTQSTARDILGYHMPTIEAAGYEIVLDIHDELITETPNTDDFTSDELAQLMSAPVPFMPGMPLAAAGFETTRYRKE